MQGCHENFIQRCDVFAKLHDEYKTFITGDTIRLPLSWVAELVCTESQSIGTKSGCYFEILVSDPQHTISRILKLCMVGIRYGQVCGNTM